MILSRKTLRRIILKEVKRALLNDNLFESLLDDIVSVEDMGEEIKSVKDKGAVALLDDAINVDEFKDQIGNIEDSKLESLLASIRGSLTSGTFSKLRDAISAKSDMDAEIKKRIDSM